MMSIIFLFYLLLESYNQAIVLTSEDFDVSVKEGTWFVKFYTGWCPHCKKLSPVWDNLSDTARDEEADFFVGKVNCEEEKGICKQNNVNGYPTLLLFTEGEFIGEYYGKRSVENFMKFVKQQQTVIEFGGELKVLDEKKFDEEVMYRNKWIVGCLPDSKKRVEELQKWKDYALHFKNSKFHISILDSENVSDLKRYLELPKNCDTPRVLYIYKGRVNEISEENVLDVIREGIEEGKASFLEEYDDGSKGIEKPLVRYLKAMDKRNQIKKYMWIVMIVFGCLFFVFLILAILARRQGWTDDSKVE